MTDPEEKHKETTENEHRGQFKPILDYSFFLLFRRYINEKTEIGNLLSHVAAQEFKIHFFKPLDTEHKIFPPRFSVVFDYKKHVRYTVRVYTEKLSTNQPLKQYRGWYI